MAEESHLRSESFGPLEQSNHKDGQYIHLYEKTGILT